jgi:8-oxo-dGTP pyrophosphatase MutT (NUDIX family)
MGNSFESHMEDLIKSDKPSYYSAVVVINNEGKVLLGKRLEDGKWTSPAGGSEPNENNPLKTAVRELFEEAGIAADPRFLQPISQSKCKNGKICHVYLYVCSSSILVTSKLDPDQEVKTWKWFSMDEIPNALRDDDNRFTSVREAFMKFHNVTKSLVETLEKGGKPAAIGEVRNFGGTDYKKVGNGIWNPVVRPEEKKLEQMESKKEKSPKQTLQDKLQEKTQISQGEKHLNDLKNQAIVPDQKTRSGHPMFTSVDSALAHGYKLEDYREAGNFYYDRALKMGNNIEMLRNSGQEVDPAFIKIMQHNSKLSNQFIKQANVVQSRQDKIKKSTVLMGHADAAEISTSDFAIEQKLSNESGQLTRIQEIMSGYEYGDEPRSIPMDKGVLYLVKVEEGLYSGMFKNIENGMEDNSKVRIERMTLPTVVQFCFAKEWMKPIVKTEPETTSKPNIESLVEKLSFEEHKSIVEDQFDKKIKILELLNKLVN